MTLITAADFATIARVAAPPTNVSVCRDFSAMPPQPGHNGRTLKFTLSDPSIGRDGHTIASTAWQLGNYRANPVFLWAHDSSQPPIGRMVEIGTTDQRLMGTVQFPDEGKYPFADTVFNLYRSGYLNASSAGWMPLEWSFSKDRSRQGGIDFTKVDALEFSAVPVPALPTALVSARSAGIDTGPLYTWVEKVLDGGDQVLISRTELEELHAAAKPDGGSEEAMRRARAAEIRQQYLAGMVEDEAIAQRRAAAARLRSELGCDDENAQIRRILARKVRAECELLLIGNIRGS